MGQYQENNSFGGRETQPDHGRDEVETRRFPSGDTSSHVQVSGRPIALERDLRYELRSQLGVGGMGEVLLHHDHWIGRSVAMKVLRAEIRDQASLRARFLREARVQGQLEHPSIVPVYDMGRTSQGEEFFTMKRIVGHTLAEVLSDTRQDSTGGRWLSQRRLLGAFSQVCLTVAYAHSKGVIHRDIKPQNIMLGHFGEVYLLDWGIAKVFDSSDLEVAGTTGPGDSIVAETQHGELMGTPAYMPPEQLRGEPTTDAADIYSLGVVLFEILTHSRLHGARNLTAELARAPIAPSERAPSLGIAPELDALCLSAIAPNPQNRIASARALSDAIERYLDGERDAEARKALSSAHVRNASDAMTALSLDPNDEQLRSRALGELGKAIALDATNRDAIRALARALEADEGELPKSAQAELDNVAAKDRLELAGRGVRYRLVWLLLLPLVLWMGVKLPWVLAALGAVVVTSAVVSLWASRAKNASVRLRTSVLIGAFGIAFPTVTMVAAIAFAPFVLAPSLAGLFATVLLVGGRLSRGGAATVILAAFASVSLPFALSEFRVIPPSFTIAGGTITILPTIFAFEPIPTRVFLWVTSLVQVAATAFLAIQAVRVISRSERKNFLRAYRLRQLVPNGIESARPPR